MSNVKINRNNSINSDISQSSDSVKQVKDNPGFKAFQSKVASKSLCRRAVGVITGVVGAAGAAVGGIFAIKVGIAAMIGTLAGLVGAAAAPFVLIGMGALCIAAIIGGVVFFVKNSKENIYIKELNKLLQNDGVEDKIENKKQAISYLNEMISKHKEGSVEYNATVRFLNENTEIFKLCLGSKDRELFDGIAKFLINVSKNECEKTEYAIKLIIEDCLNLNSTELNTDAVELLTTFLKDNDTKSLACGIVKSKGFSENIQRFLKSKNNGLKTNTIALVSEMLKNENTKDTAKEIIKDYIKSDNTRSMNNAIKLLTELLKNESVQTTVVQIVKNCIEQEDLELMSNTIKLLTEMLKNKNTQAFAEEIIKKYSEKNGGWLGSGNDQLKANTIALLTEMLKNKNTQAFAEEIIKKYSEKIGGWLGSGNDQLKANTIALLTEMLKSEKSENIDLADSAKKIITDSVDKKNDFGGENFAGKMKGCLGSGNDGLKIKTVELLNNMLVGSNDELKSKSKEILKSDVLNTKGMFNIFLNDGGNVNEEAISLLSPMCKDGEIKNILSKLIGENLVKKLEEQGNDIKSADVVNVLYENAIVEKIFSDENKKYIINILKDVDGLHNFNIDFDENGQIKEVKIEEQKELFNENRPNLEALKKQSIIDFGRDLKSIKTANGGIINAEGNRTNNEEFLEKIFKDAKISEDAKNLIYKFPGQSTIGTRAHLVNGAASSLCDVLTSFRDTMCSKLNSCGITVNTDGSVEVQMRRIGIINACAYNLPMAIEEVHTFKINKGDDRYETTDAKITVYKLEKTDIQLNEEKTGVQLTEENLKARDVLSQVSYNRDEGNNENNKKA